MRKILKLTAIFTGVISILSIVVLGCIYMEDVMSYLRILYAKVTHKIGKKDM